jgi:hypothetical protein
MVTLWSQDEPEPEPLPKVIDVAPISEEEMIDMYTWI